MQITWYGTAALVLEDKLIGISIDPYLGYPYKIDQEERQKMIRDFTQRDSWLITHGHFDHIQDIPQMIKGKTIQVYCTKTPKQTLLKRKVQPEQLKEIVVDESFQIGNWTIKAIQGRHCHFDLPLILRTGCRFEFFMHPLRLGKLLKNLMSYPENREILFYEIQAPECRIQILGSLGLQEKEVYPTDADILIMAFQGRSDLDETAMKIVRRLKPRQILLDHYDDAFPPVSSQIDTTNFIAKCREAGIPCEAMVKGETWIWKNKKDIGVTEKTVVG